MRLFDHVGVPTDEIQSNEMYVPATKVWVTDPEQHPYKMEFLRFEPDSPVKGAVRNQPHIAFRVKNLNEAIEGEEVVLGPFDATKTLRVAFIVKDGAVYEFMESTGEGHWFEGNSAT